MRLYFWSIMNMILLDISSKELCRWLAFERPHTWPSAVIEMSRACLLVELSCRFFKHFVFTVTTCNLKCPDHLHTRLRDTLRRGTVGSEAGHEAEVVKSRAGIASRSNRFSMFPANF